MSAGPRLTRVEHVQLAMPAGGEDAARRFYAGVLGLNEAPKPAELARRGGCWFERGELKVHLGVEADFRPARKAHPAFVCENLDAVLAAAAAHGAETTPAEQLAPYRRAFAFDPFGNRLEFMEQSA